MRRGYVGGVQSPVLQAWLPAGSQAVDQGAYPPRASGVAPRLLIRVCTDLGALGLCAQAAWQLFWVPTNLGFRCVLELLIRCSRSRG